MVGRALHGPVQRPGALPPGTGAGAGKRPGRPAVGWPDRVSSARVEWSIAKGS